MLVEIIMEIIFYVQICVTSATLSDVQQVMVADGRFVCYVSGGFPLLFGGCSIGVIMEWNIAFVPFYRYACLYFFPRNWFPLGTMRNNGILHMKLSVK